jgi:TolB-like protein/DNA-binding winged helix-turn-helix (wHTH) protein
MEQEGATAPQMIGYQIDDLIINLGQQRVTRAGSDIPLPHLSFDLLVTLAQAAPNFVSFDQLCERVWPGLVIAPETISQRVKLVRDALGDDPHAPRYIAGIRGRGYRMVAAVRTLVDQPQIHTPVGDKPKSDADRGSDSASSDPSALPSHMKVLPGRRFDRVIVGVLAVLAVGLAYVVVDRFWISKHAVVVQSVRSAQQEAARDASTVTVAAFNPPPHSIAVLPFVNMSGDASQQYFSDGLTEELLNSLSRINELQVAARTSSFSFQGEHPDIATVAHKLNVASVLEGSVRRSGHTVRITAQLNNAVTGFHIWSQAYDRDLGDVLQLQSEIATAVAEALKVKLLGDAVARIELGGTRNPAALDAYLRATNAHWAVRDPKDDELASVAAYSEAIRLDPSYAFALAGRSIALSDYAQWVTGQALRDALAKSEADARRAIALAPELAEGHLALAAFSQSSLDFVQAATEFQRALELAPGNARVLRDYGLFTAYMGRADPGIAAARRAAVLDPLNPAGRQLLGETLKSARRPEEALTAYQELVALLPGAPGSYALRGEAGLLDESAVPRRDLLQAGSPGGRAGDARQGTSREWRGAGVLLRLGLRPVGKCRQGARVAGDSLPGA